MKRRAVLAVAGIALSGGIAGCTSDGASTPQCRLMHEIVDGSDDYEVAETYRYEELSDDARRVFDEALEEGSYATAELDRDPPEFRYWDETSAYEVAYQNETHTLLTYTGEGCESE